MIPCEVIIKAPGEAVVKRPNFPLIDVKLIPTRFGIKQISRTLGSMAPDSFRVSCADGGALVKGRYEFTLVLYSDKACTVELCRAVGEYDGDGTLSFVPILTSTGNFFYSVAMTNAAGDVQTLLSDSYVVKKPA